MFWMLVIIAALAYAASTMSEYTAFVKEIQPRMARLQKESGNLKKTIEAGSSEVGHLEASLQEDQDLIEDLHRETVSAQDELRRQSAREQKL